MAFDDPTPPQTEPRRLSIVPFTGGWAIKHGEGFLGVSACREEATRLLHVLQDVQPERLRPST
ncbi:MAG TPA: hypothetical protein VGM25_10795 [Caulobacteraceae bacterium]|jgi:hypothetical protein